MLGQVNINGENKVDVAIKRLKSFEPPEGYYLAFSGGKDSQCIYHLAKMAGVKFDAHYSVTTVDPPELMRFIRDNYPDVEWERPRDKDGKAVSMWTLIPEHTVPPTRKVRYCCDVLKEQGGKGRVVVTGVRWAESATRKNTHGLVDVRTQSKKIINDSLENNPAASLNTRGGLVFNDDNVETRKTVEFCYQKRRTTINPIIDWDEDEVWEFIKEWAKVPYCSLYDEGFTRLGCIGCPLQGTAGMLRDFKRWPRYKELYIRAFDEMLKRHPAATDAYGEVPTGGGRQILENTMDFARGQRFFDTSGGADEAEQIPGNQLQSLDGRGQYGDLAEPLPLSGGGYGRKNGSTGQRNRTSNSGRRTPVDPDHFLRRAKDGEDALEIFLKNPFNF